jgi:F-type H+-transporting ATPase subunit epsilon
MSIRCEIVSQDRLVFEGNADIVVIPGEAGVMGILPNHAPLLSTLKYGILTVRYRGKEEIFTISGGIVEVQPDLVTVLADAAENVLEIDVARAEAAKRRAEELLQQGPPADMDVYMRMEAALKRSNLRLEAVNRYRRSRIPGTRGASEGESG